MAKYLSCVANTATSTNTIADNISRAEEKEAVRELERRSGSSISNPLCSDFPVGVVPEHNIPQLIWFGQNFPKIRKVG